jgi:hypothetical protein
MKLVPLRIFSGLIFAAAACAQAHAIEIRVSSKALEQTLTRQLFTGEGGRYYIRGNAKSACYVYAEDPKISFVNDRIVVHVKTHSKLGTSLRGACLGIGLNTDADVSVIPDAQGEIVGFRDARIEHLSESKELNFLLVPFLSRQLPQQMKVNAADLMRQLLANSTQTTGYDLRLDNLKIHSMMVDQDALAVDLDGTLSVH